MITIEQIIDIIDNSDLAASAKTYISNNNIFDYKEEVSQLAAVIMNEIEKDRN